MKKNEIVTMIISICTLISLFCSVMFWVYKANELPKVVENHEQRIDNLEKQITENNTKTELIYQAVLEIRRSVLYNK